MDCRLGLFCPVLAQTSKQAPAILAGVFLFLPEFFWGLSAAETHKKQNFKKT
jgi:hypothetical protein